MIDTGSAVVASAVVHPFQRDEVHFGFDDEVAQAAAILETMTYLDPNDLVGANVIRDLLAGMQEVQHDG